MYSPPLLQGIPLLLGNQVKACCLGFSTFLGKRTGTVFLMRYFQVFDVVVVCVCVCVCVCLRLSIVKASSVWIKWDTREQINDVLLKTLNSYVDSLYRYFIMQNLTFQLATLSCSHTRSRKSHDLTSVRLVFRTWSFHSAFSRRCIRYTVRREPICFQTWHSREDSQSI